MSLNTTPAATPATPATPADTRTLAFKAMCQPGAGTEVTIVVGDYRYHYRKQGGLLPDLVGVSRLSSST